MENNHTHETHKDTDSLIHKILQTKPKQQTIVDFVEFEKTVLLKLSHKQFEAVAYMMIAFSKGLRSRSIFLSKEVSKSTEDLQTLSYHTKAKKDGKQLVKKSLLLLKSRLLNDNDSLDRNFTKDLLNGFPQFVLKNREIGKVAKEYETTASETSFNSFGAMHNLPEFAFDEGQERINTFDLMRATEKIELDPTSHHKNSIDLNYFSASALRNRSTFTKNHFNEAEEDKNDEGGVVSASQTAIKNSGFDSFLNQTFKNISFSNNATRNSIFRKQRAISSTKLGTASFLANIKEAEILDRFPIEHAKDKTQESLYLGLAKKENKFIRLCVAMKRHKDRILPNNELLQGSESLSAPVFMSEDRGIERTTFRFESSFKDKDRDRMLQTPIYDTPIHFDNYGGLGSQNFDPLENMEVPNFFPHMLAPIDEVTDDYTTIGPGNLKENILKSNANIFEKAGAIFESLIQLVEEQKTINLEDHRSNSDVDSLLFFKLVSGSGVRYKLCQNDNLHCSPIELRKPK